MYHRMYLRRCSMSSISEESETGDDDHLDDEFIICENNHNKVNQSEQNSTPSVTAVENCLGDLTNFKEEIREAYEELSTLERQARSKTVSNPFRIEQDELDILLEQLQTLEQRLDEKKMSHPHVPRHEQVEQKTMSPSIMAQFDELDQALATLTNTLNSVEVDLIDSGHSSSSSGVSDSTTIHHQQQDDQDRARQLDTELDEHFSDSGLSQSTESISLPLKQSAQFRTHSQLSNTSSIISCDTLKQKVPIDNPIQLALEKMHEANIRKMFVKIHNDDQSTKNILIDETMSVHDIIVMLLYKFHLKPNYNFTLVEDLPDLHIYRILEDHQNLIQNAISHWPRDTSNRICFQEHSNHYSMFNNPKEFFAIDGKNNERHLNPMYPEYISSDNLILPDDITGTIYLKEKTRKIWKKHSCILRQSGIYQIPKASSSKRDLICLIKVDANLQLYQAKNWTEALRAPTSFGFALKYAHIQKKSNKYIHYLCTNTADECQRWINGIRVVLYGIQLYQNHQQRKQLLEHDVDHLGKLLPNQHYFNFIQSNSSPSVSHSNSIISLPINHIVSDLSLSTSKSFIDFDTASTSQTFHSLGNSDRVKTPKHSFTRSSSFHASLRRSSKYESNLKRTSSISPPDASQRKPKEAEFKRSKSSRDIESKSNQRKDFTEISKSSSNGTIIPFIHQCIQAERNSARSKVPLSPPRRPPPPIPDKKIPTPTMATSTVIIDNHIYDSFQESPPLIRSTRLLTTDLDKPIEQIRTVVIPRSHSVRVTEL